MGEDDKAGRGNVLVLAAYTPSLWNFRRQMIELLGMRGYKVIACGPAHQEASARLGSLNVCFKELGPNRTSLNPLSDIRYLWQLLHLCREFKPKAVISYTAKPVIWGSIAAAMAGVPRIIAIITGLGFAFIEGARRRSIASLLVEALYRVALRACHVVIFQNPDDRAEFTRRKLIGENTCSFVVKGSGVDIKWFAVEKLAKAPIFLLIARMLRDKGIREFCEAARMVKQRYPQAQFRLVGWFDEGNPRAITPRDITIWCGGDSAQYRGPVEDVRLELAQCRVYVLPSYREGTPRTVLEAMAMGRPIITTDVPGCRETVRDGWNGYLVPAGDSSALAEAMEKFLVYPALAESMGANSRELVEAHYDAWRVAESVLGGSGL